MTFPLEEKLQYSILSIFCLLFFYSVYFIKMLCQKRKGIQTRQIGKRKEKGLHTVEVLMGIATLLAPFFELLSICLNWSYLPPSARFTGFLIALCGDIIFLLSVLEMKDSWRTGIPEKDQTKLVTTGLYRFSRNPAFLGFDLMYIGLLLMYFNPLNLAFSLFPIIMLHLQILQEEKYLTSIFKDSYTEYKNKVFRYLGRR